MSYKTQTIKAPGAGSIVKAALFTFLFICCSIYSKGADRYYYQIKVYHLKNKSQEGRLDKYLRDAYLPALHRAGIKQAGVFKPIVQDTADQVIYVFIPFSNLNKFKKLSEVLNDDKLMAASGQDYSAALYNDAPYQRIESILLLSFSAMPKPVTPKLTGPMNERVYELRSYESGTENYSENKIEMFNRYEVDIFRKLDFNAVFYGQVILGSRMPNLMYMTTFNNKADRDKHWAEFSPEYKKISGLPEYQNNVSKNVTSFLYPTDYSDF